MNRPLIAWLLAIIATLALLLILDGRADAQPAPPDHGSGTAAECAAHGCLYGHERGCHYSRDGSSSCGAIDYGIAHERLADGEGVTADYPRGRHFVRVLWPHPYDPARRSSWDRLAGCESGHRWSYNGGSGFDGALQFHPNTWRAYGGGQFAPYAWQASPVHQIVVAERVLWLGYGPHGPQGRGAWPGCLAAGRGAPYPP